MDSSTGENSYKNILKGTFVFGGVQIFQIFINLLRGKFVALFLGPVGMGISSLYTVAVTTLCQFASFGLNLAIVKEIATNKDNEETLAIVMSISRKLVLWSAIFGCLSCFALSPLLSRLTFGNTEYTIGFMALSIMVFFTLVGGGEMSFLQGLHEVKRLSYASLIGASVGLIIGIPLYYLYGTDGIVPAMIVLSISTFLFYRYSIRRIRVTKVNAHLRENITLVKALVSMGLVLMAGSIFGTIANYALNSVIRNWGSIENVGLFQAANSISNQYVGMVFTAMSLDYFPRLTSASNDNHKMCEVVNRQILIVALLISPLVCILILTAPLVIKILLTDAFLPVMPLMRWLGLAVMFRALSFPMGYISFAKGNKKLFLWTEGIFGNVVTLSVCSIMYYIWGLIGLGIGTVITYLIMISMYVLINNRYYGYRIDKAMINKILLYTVIPIVVFLASFIEMQLLSYLIMGSVTVFIIVMSLIKFKNLFRVNENQLNI